jgi:hypothetical protein
MDATALWREVVEELETLGIKARVVPVERLADARARVDGGRAPRGGGAGGGPPRAPSARP